MLHLPVKFLFPFQVISLQNLALPYKNKFKEWKMNPFLKEQGKFKQVLNINQELDQTAVLQEDNSTSFSIEQLFVSVYSFPVHGRM